MKIHGRMDDEYFNVLYNFICVEILTTTHCSEKKEREHVKFPQGNLIRESLTFDRYLSFFVRVEKPQSNHH